ncbi:tumor necrosis factor receptor superfamily member 4 [Pungitius pungitius]|uniref:tumor necrosis factor receptor superfamily member 4 n=1 Tax=Pungitius pungitius TaxID=134920 RepID=UPI002E1350F0
MVIFKQLIFTLIFYEFAVDLNAATCPKGQRILKTTGCETCPSDGFQDEENETQVCKACTKCDSKTGSVVKKACTKETNTICQCLEGFVSWEDDSSSCKCGIGFGIQGPKCSKCEDGYFTTDINLQCKKWKECKCGVKTNGTTSSDVICNAEFQGCIAKNTPRTNYLTTPPGSKKTVSLITRLTSPHPRKTAHTQRIPTGTTTTTPSRTVTHIGTGLALVTLGIFGLLTLIAVTYKLRFTHPPAAPKNDSLCRRPVEESGESSLCSVKLNPEEH